MHVLAFEKMEGLATTTRGLGLYIPRRAFLDRRIGRMFKASGYARS